MKNNIIAIASDHGGFELKEELIKYLNSINYDVIDLGCNNTDSVDYPDYGIKLSKYVIKNKLPFGIAICGTGIGISIVCNKVKKIRAALVHDINTAKLAKQHNNANILCLGGRIITTDLAKSIINTFINTSFELRHQKRLDKILRYEEKLENE